MNSDNYAGNPSAHAPAATGTAHTNPSSRVAFQPSPTATSASAPAMNVMVTSLGEGREGRPPPPYPSSSPSHPPSQQQRITSSVPLPHIQHQPSAPSPPSSSSSTGVNLLQQHYQHLQHQRNRHVQAFVSTHHQQPQHHPHPQQPQYHAPPPTSGSGGTPSGGGPTNASPTRSSMPPHPYPTQQQPPVSQHHPHSHAHPHPPAPHSHPGYAQPLSSSPQTYTNTIPLSSGAPTTSSSHHHHYPTSATPGAPPYSFVVASSPSPSSPASSSASGSSFMSSYQMRPPTSPSSSRMMMGSASSPVPLSSPVTMPRAPATGASSAGRGRVPNFASPSSFSSFRYTPSNANSPQSVPPSLNSQYSSPAPQRYATSFTSSPVPISPYGTMMTTPTAQQDGRRGRERTTAKASEDDEFIPNSSAKNFVPRQRERRQRKPTQRLADYEEMNSEEEEEEDMEEEEDEELQLEDDSEDDDYGSSRRSSSRQPRGRRQSSAAASASASAASASAATEPLSEEQQQQLLLQQRYYLQQQQHQLSSPPPQRRQQPTEEQRLKKCKTVINKLRRHKDAWPFNQPVDPEELGIPDYFEIIKNPMDLGTIHDKLQSGDYETVDQFVADVELVWSNCLAYNPPEDPICKWANTLSKEFQKLMQQHTLKVGAGRGDGDDEDYRGGAGGGRGRGRGRPPGRHSSAASSELGSVTEVGMDGTSSRQTRRRASARLSNKDKRYYESDEEFSFEEEEEENEESQAAVEAAEEEKPKGPVVEKIMAHRVALTLEEKKRLKEEKRAKKRELKEERKREKQKKEQIDVESSDKTKEEEVEKADKGKDKEKDTNNTAKRQLRSSSKEVEKAKSAKSVEAAAEVKGAKRVLGKEGSQEESGYEYFIKWKEMSYIHCEWVSAATIEAEGPGGRAKINRYWKKRNKRQMMSGKEFAMEEAEEGEYFPPEFCEVERIIATDTVILSTIDDDNAEDDDSSSTSENESEQEESTKQTTKSEQNIEKKAMTSESLQEEKMKEEKESANGREEQNNEEETKPNEDGSLNDAQSDIKAQTEELTTEKVKIEPTTNSASSLPKILPLEPSTSSSSSQTLSSSSSVTYTSVPSHTTQSYSTPANGSHFMHNISSPVPATQARVTYSSAPTAAYPAHPHSLSSTPPPYTFVHSYPAGGVPGTLSPNHHLPYSPQSQQHHIPHQEVEQEEEEEEEEGDQEQPLGPNEKKVRRFLVKWKGLPYSECTWELESDLKGYKTKIKEFYSFHTPDPDRPRSSNATPRPPASAFQTLSDPVFKGGNKLRSYQLQGLNWLVYCWFNRRGSILADEMGLGKTVQSVSFLEHVCNAQGICGPFLVLVPLSTLPHWQREFEAWTDMNVVVYTGDAESRSIIRQYEWYYSKLNGIPPRKSRRAGRSGPATGPNAGYKFQALITTYEMILRSDWSELSRIPWRVMLVDEAHRLKNRSSKLLEHLQSFKTEHRVILTGTPLQNNTTELWTLLNFIEPHIFHSLPLFLQNFGDLQNSEQVRNLHILLRPHLLRRLKEDVENSIPPKEEVVVEVELTSLQKKYYRAILERNRDFLYKGCHSSNVPNLINVVMQLRKACNHPFLIKGVEDKETAALTTQEDYYRLLIQSAGKLALLDKLLPKLKAGGHRVLIFSQMVRVLDLLETYLHYKNYLYERLDGRVRGSERQSAIDRFSRPGSNRFVFLLCTRAGGLGINLATADTVVIYDSDWNPQNDLQAQARCHRIGQTKDVKVYRLITRNTYERHMFERTSKKLGLDQAVLDNMGNTNGKGNGKATKESLAEMGKEIDNLLKYGAYDLFRGEDDKEGANGKVEDMFGEDDIDKILERNATLVRYDDNNNTDNKDAPQQRSSTFSKAVFQSSEADSAIDINAENFWELILPEAKDTASVVRRLKQGEPGKSPEKEKEFWADLKTVVEEAIEQWEQKLEIPKDLHVIMGVLEEIVQGTSGVQFSDRHVNMARNWLLILNRPRRRRRRGEQESSSLNLLSEESNKNQRNKRKRTSERNASRSSRRGAKRGEDEGEGEEADTYSLDEDEDESALSSADDFSDGSRRPNKRARGRGNEKRKPWNMSERKRAQEAILAFCRPCWEEIKQCKGLNRRSTEDIKEFALAFLCQCSLVAQQLLQQQSSEKSSNSASGSNAVDEEDVQAFEEALAFCSSAGSRYTRSAVADHLLDGEASSTSSSTNGSESSSSTEQQNASPTVPIMGQKEKKQRVDRHKVLQDEQYITNIKRKAKTWAKRLLLLKRLREEVEHFPSLSAFCLPSLWTPNHSQKQSPAPWWGMVEDRDLLLGTYKHGFGCFDTMIADEELSFGKTLKGEEQGSGAGAASPSASLVSRLRSSSRRRSSRGGGKDHDEEENQDKDKNVGSTRGWPAKRLLNLRVKSVLDLVAKLKKAEAKRKEREERQEQREKRKRSKREQLEKERNERVQRRQQKLAEKVLKSQERKREWSKRERQDFRAAIMAHGPGDWTLIKEKANLTNKSEEAIAKCYEELMELARQMTAEFPDPYIFLKKKNKPTYRKTEGEDGEDDEDREEEEEEEEVEEEEEEEVATIVKKKKDADSCKEDADMEGSDDDEHKKKKQKRSNSEKGKPNVDVNKEGEEDEEEEEEEDGETGKETKAKRPSSLKQKKERAIEVFKASTPQQEELLDNVFGISPIVARRLLEREELWHKLRQQLLPHPHLISRLAYRCNNKKMPRWWCSPEHDVILLRAIDKYGIGNTTGEWDKFLSQKKKSKKRSDSSSGGITQQTIFCCPFYKSIGAVQRIIREESESSTSSERGEEQEYEPTEEDIAEKDKRNKSAPKKVKDVFLLKFVEDKAPLLQRLNHYFHLVLTEEEEEKANEEQEDKKKKHKKDKKKQKDKKKKGTKRKASSEEEAEGDAIYDRPYRTGGIDRKRRKASSTSSPASSSDIEPPPSPSLSGLRKSTRHKSASRSSKSSSSSSSSSTLSFSSSSSLPTVSIERDAEGHPILPLSVKGATIHSLGHIIWNRPGFHSKNYLWPAGFRSTRRLPSLKDSNKMATYISEIIDTGGDAPEFRVTPSEDGEEEEGKGGREKKAGKKGEKKTFYWKHHTSSGVWTQALKAIKRKSNVSVSGPEMFGFSSSVVKKLFQELPNATKCRDYVFVEFAEEPPVHSSSSSSSSTSASTTTTKKEAERKQRKQEEEKEREKEKLSATLTSIREELLERQQEEEGEGGGKKKQSLQELQDEVKRLKAQLQQQYAEMTKEKEEKEDEKEEEEEEDDEGEEKEEEEQEEPEKEMEMEEEDDENDDEGKEEEEEQEEENDVEEEIEELEEDEEEEAESDSDSESESEDEEDSSSTE